MSPRVADPALSALKRATDAVSEELLVTRDRGAGTVDRAVFSTSELTIVSTTVPGLSKIPFQTLLALGSWRKRLDLMYWDVDGDLLKQTGRRLRPGRYLVQAHPGRGTANLVSLPGRKTLGEGDLCICYQQHPTVMEKIVDVGLDSVSFDKKKHTAKVCGHVTVEGPLGAHITITACVTVQL